jgi:hypothetical protein
MSRRPAVTTAQAAATKAEAVADGLRAWLQTQPTRTASHREATDAATEKGEPLTGRPVTALRADVVEPDPLVAAATQTAQPDLGSAAAAAPSQDPIRSERGSALRLDHTDWLHHRLLITGSAADLVCLRATACGAGTVPWHLDFDRMEEDLFHLLVAPPARAAELSSHTRSLSLAGARILAGQLRAAAARRHALAIARVGHSAACPFDLHALVPVPDAILRRGPDDSDALDWLWTHWGTTQTLRHVVEDEAAAGATATRRPAAAGKGVWALTFWSADWTPWRALAQVAGRWPTLRFETRPIYDMP